MNFRFINPHNVRWLVPAWVNEPFDVSTELDRMLGDYFAGRKPPRWDSRLPFWIEFKANGGKWGIRIAEPDDEVDNSGEITFETAEYVFSFQLNDILKGSPRADQHHCVYSHVVGTDCPLPYVGITKRRWFDRFAEHETSARSGSHYLFHRALREHAGKKISHKVLYSMVTHDAAMALEEDIVGLSSLYPLGLNMIPGGAAGIRYLHTLGIAARNAVERDAAVERLASREDIDGRPNPLCAARWEADQDFVNRVICGHSGRLTVEQVRMVRTLHALGRSAQEISRATGLAAQRLARVARGSTYARVA